MKEIKIFLFVLLILLQSQTALSVVYFYIDMTCAGTKAAGMGGAFIGVADDATAITWNPAGLIQISRPENSIISSKRNLKYELMGRKSESSNFSIDFISAAYPLKKNNLVIAAAYQKPFDYNYDYKDDNELEKSTGACNSFSIGVAKRILPYFSTGVTMNIWFGNVDYEYQYFEHDYNSYEDDWYDYEFVYDCEQTFKGLNFILGGFIDLDTLDEPIPLKFGITYRSAFKQKAKEEGLMKEYVDWESGGSYYWEEDTDGSRKNEIPSMFGLGASYNFNDNFKLAADYEIRAYSDSNINDHNENLKQYRIGAEYIFVTDFVTVPLRIGYFTDPKLLTDANSKQVIGTGFSLGTGLNFNRFIIDFAYSKSTCERYLGSYGNQKLSDSKLIFSGTLYF